MIGDDLYLDVLINESRAAEGQARPLTSQEINAFFAHEVHHLAYDRLLETKRQSLHLTASEERAWGLLAALMKEGSATYLVNGNSDLEKLRRQPELKSDFEQIDRLLPALQALLASILSGDMSAEEIEAQEAGFTGNKLHVMGAVLLDQVKKSDGKQGIFHCMRDPRILLRSYNRSAAKSPGTFQFDPGLATRLGSIGDR